MILNYMNTALVGYFVCVIVLLQCFKSFAQIHQSHTTTQTNKTDPGSSRSTAPKLCELKWLILPMEFGGFGEGGYLARMTVASHQKKLSDSKVK